MKLTITGRHFEVSGDLSKYTEKKFSKLEKYFHRLIDVEIVMYQEKHNNIIEAVINGDGVKIFATEKASDMYSSVDLLRKSLEMQAKKHKEKHSGHKVSPLKSATAATENTQPVKKIEVVYNYAAKKPKDEIEAFLEMKLENKEFILFNKSINNDNKNNIFAVIFRSDDGYKMAEIPQKILKGKKIDPEKLIEFNITVGDDSLTKPKIKFKKSKNKSIKISTTENALEEITASTDNFMPFLNDETNAFNIIYKNGNSIEVVIPPA